MDGEDPCLLIHHRFNGKVSGEGRFAVESLPTYWTARFVALHSVSVPRSTKHNNGAYTSIHPITQTSSTYCVTALSETLALAHVESRRDSQARCYTGPR